MRFPSGPGGAGGRYGAASVEKPETLEGPLVGIEKNGSRTTIAAKRLTVSSGVGVGPAGALYVANYGIFPCAGQVLRIAP